MCFGRRSKRSSAGQHNGNARPAAGGCGGGSGGTLSSSAHSSPPRFGKSSLPPQSFIPPPTPSPTRTYTGSSKGGSYSPSPQCPNIFSPPPDPPPRFEPYVPDSDEHELPPPPQVGHESSPASNAPGDLADAGNAFCFSNPLSQPQRFTSFALSQIDGGTMSLAPAPPSFQGTITNSKILPYLPRIATAKAGCPDACLISALPLYAAGYHHPSNTGRTKSIFLEISLDRLPPSGAAVAIGFVACPYPSFRLPGWNRGSLGVHSDDGRRYCNDAYGGKDFVAPWRQGESVGIGMRFPDGKDRGGGQREIWFERGGVREGMWRLDEEVDAELDRDPRLGLEGGHDVYAAIGVWGPGVVVSVLRFESR